MGVAQRVAEGPALALGRAVAERRPLGGGRDARDGQRGERVPLGGRQTLGDAARVGERRRVARADGERRQRPAEFRERRPRVRPAQFQGPQARERLAGRLDARGGGRSGKGKADGSRTPSALTRRTTSTTGRRSSSGFSDASNVSA